MLRLWLLEVAFNLFSEYKLGSAIFNRTVEAVTYGNYMVQITFLSYWMIKKWSNKITICTTACVWRKLREENLSLKYWWKLRKSKDLLVIICE